MGSIGFRLLSHRRLSLDVGGICAMTQKCASASRKQALDLVMLM